MASAISIPSKPRSLVVFFALAFGISWAVWVPAALASYGLVSFQVDSTLSGLLGVFGPFVATLITTAIYDGRAGFSTLFKRLLTWRVGIQWYLFVLLWPAVLSLAKTAIAILLGSAAPDFSQPPFVQLYPLPPELLNATPFIMFLPFVFLQQTLVGSSMGEEIGWRGYALPRMQTRQSSLHASLLLGILWSVWHFPLWLTKGHPMQGAFFGWPVLGLVATAILFTWVYNNTRGSLLLALLFHTSIAITGLFLSSAETHPLIDVALSWGVAVLVIAVFGPKHLSREAMGA
ncbi:MAG: CPBP family intramembrane metalloprotease [Chloroflexi bacterium]|nr:CPBP family intramembrane metalloprotease [Chloroflexota bacterium]